LAHFPVLTLAAISAFGFILATVVLVAGSVWLSIALYAVTILVLCWVIAIFSGRSAK
jgi:hypothetical protein